YSMLRSHLTLVTLFSFFLHFSLSNLDLHSFPTRRSSDLRWPSYEPCCAGRLHSTGSADSWGVPGLPSHQGDTNSRRIRRSHGRRSEEHTSELQSRFDLVCRLLLEKKKKKKTISSYQLK